MRFGEDMLKKLVIPAAVLPYQTPVYKLNNDPSKLLSWDFVVQRMTQARHYWLATTSLDGQPHSTPVWGLWHENRLHIEGNPNSRWIRNLQQNPQISVSLPSGDKVVIIEGNVQFIEDDELDEAAWERLDTAFQTKYAVEQGSPYIVVHPRKIMAWDTEGLETMTRWIFEAESE
jgi:general stress protein 26